MQLSRRFILKGFAATFFIGATGGPVVASKPVAPQTNGSGWLLCNGQEISRTAYSELFSHIGAAYGEGDGASTFNVPDLSLNVPPEDSNVMPLYYCIKPSGPRIGAIVAFTSSGLAV